ncbi:MAG: hypothetical protein ACM3MG_13045 [Bacillota bacterium]
MKTVITLALLVFGVSAHGKNVAHLTVGSYTLISGNSDLCPNFKIRSKDLTAKSIYLGKNQIFITENSLSTAKSDTDAMCEFQDQSLRTETGSETTLKMISKEICDGKIRSETTSTASIRNKEITLTIEVPGAQTEICKFKSR